MNSLRKVSVSLVTEEWEGFFHCWAGTSEYPLAVVEDYHGHVHLLVHDTIRFLDHPYNERM